MRRSAMSLIELLVVLAILGLLLAMILPAVQSARETARRMQCSSNLRQIAVAVHQYEAAFHVLPAGNQRGYSYLAAILPYIEQQPLYSRIDWSVPAYNGPSTQIKEHIRLYVCPSDGLAVQSPIAASYSGNMGYNVQQLGYNGAFHPGSIAVSGEDRGQCFAPNDFSDGLSQTALLSEILFGDMSRQARRTKWITAECFETGRFDEFLQACLGRQFEIFPDGSPGGTPFRGWPWLEGQAGVTLYTHSLTPNQYSCVNCNMSTFGAYTAASNHPQGVVLCNGDGSVHFVSDSVELRVWRAAGTRNGGD